MVLNRRGQTIFFLLMLAIVVIIIALALVPIIKSFTDNARLQTSNTAVGLDCSNTTISDWDKATCVLVDISMPYFFLGLIGLAGVIISAKLLMET